MITAREVRGAMLDFINQNSGLFLVIFSGVVAVATVVYAVLTWRLVAETRKMREVQTEPNIFVSLQSKEEWAGLIDLVIQNIGLGAAHSLKFELRPDFEYSKGMFLSEVNFIKNGVNYLAPNQTIKHFLTGLVDNKELEKTELVFRIEYENFMGKLYQKEYILDFSEFYGRRRVGHPPLIDIAKNLEKIERNIQLIISGLKKIEVVTFTKKDIEEENKKIEEQIEQFEKEQIEKGRKRGAEEK